MFIKILNIRNQISVNLLFNIVVVLICLKLILQLFSQIYSYYYFGEQLVYNNETSSYKISNIIRFYIVPIVLIPFLFYLLKLRQFYKKILLIFISTILLLLLVANIFNQSVMQVDNNQPDRSPGKGWIYVNSEELTHNSIINNIKKGQFYSSTGIKINSYEYKNNLLKIIIDNQEGISYETKIIGTKKNINIDDTEIGKTLASFNTNEINYNVPENIYYFRVKIISNKNKINYSYDNEYETAWFQPLRVDQTVEFNNNWYKGNLHTHTLWSDGEDLPRDVINWYKDNNYNFLALTDHNITQDFASNVSILDYSLMKDSNTNYKVTSGDTGRHISLRQFKKLKQKENLKLIDYKFSNTIITRIQNFFNLYFLETKPFYIALDLFEDLEKKYNEKEKFLLFKGVEITDNAKEIPVHTLGINISANIQPSSGSSILQRIENALSDVKKQETNEKMTLGIVAHPNLGYAINYEDLNNISDENNIIFEVYTGISSNHKGDDEHLSTDKMWDYALTKRILNNRSLIYGIATDDTHGLKKM